MASFRRKLTALDYPEAEAFSVEDDAKFRSLIVWLEDQKVRQYKIEERAALRDTANPEQWTQHYTKYLSDVQCPVDAADKAAVIDWLLSLAVRLEYGDNVAKYQTCANEHRERRQQQQTGGGGATEGSAPQQQQQVKLKSSNPLDDLDFGSAEFTSGLGELCKMLELPQHPDQLVMLQAASKVIKERLSNDAISKGAPVNQGKMIPLDNIDAGLDAASTGDYVVREAAKVLRLLHIRELRELQTKINECIVAAQSLTANPKTESRLGKVGR